MFIIMSSTTVPTLYNAWFCPFAQRAWLSLLEKGVQFNYVEQDPYNKTPEWLAVNPKGLVPAIEHNGKVIVESTVCIEYVDEAWNTDRHLLPSDPYDRAQVRLLSDHITKKVVPLYYQMLMKKDEAARTEAKKNITEALTSLFESEPSSDGPFFGGKSLNMVDIMLAPHAYRFQLILKHYREFSVPNDTPELQRFHRWFAAVLQNSTFKQTLPEEQRLIDEYKRYADDVTNSQVAQAIRKGTALP